MGNLPITCTRALARMAGAPAGPPELCIRTMPAEHPFSAAYSPRLICATEAWRTALARLTDGLGARERILLVTGDAGTGKTALVQDAVARWGEKVASSV